MSDFPANAQIASSPVSSDVLDHDDAPTPQWVDQVVWETREDKQDWRENGGWVSSKDFEQIKQEMAADKTFKIFPRPERICKI